MSQKSARVHARTFHQRSGFLVPAVLLVCAFAAIVIASASAAATSGVTATLDVDDVTLEPREERELRLVVTNHDDFPHRVQLRTDVETRPPWTLAYPLADFRLAAGESRPIVLTLRHDSSAQMRFHEQVTTIRVQKLEDDQEHPVLVASLAEARLAVRLLVLEGRATHSSVTVAPGAEQVVRVSFHNPSPYPVEGVLASGWLSMHALRHSQHRVLEPEHAGERIRVEAGGTHSFEVRIRVDPWSRFEERIDVWHAIVPAKAFASAPAEWRGNPPEFLRPFGYASFETHLKQLPWDEIGPERLRLSIEPASMVLAPLEQAVVRLRLENVHDQALPFALTLTATAGFNHGSLAPDHALQPGEVRFVNTTAFAGWDPFPAEGHIQFEARLNDSWGGPLARADLPMHRVVLDVEEPRDPLLVPRGGNVSARVAFMNPSRHIVEARLVSGHSISGSANIWDSAWNHGPRPVGDTVTLAPGDRFEVNVTFSLESWNTHDAIVHAWYALVPANATLDVHDPRSLPPPIVFASTRLEARMEHSAREGTDDAPETPPKRPELRADPWPNRPPAPRYPDADVRVRTNVSTLHLSPGETHAVSVLVESLRDMPLAGRLRIEDLGTPGWIVDAPADTTLALLPRGMASVSFNVTAPAEEGGFARIRISFETPSRVLGAWTLAGFAYANAAGLDAMWREQEPLPEEAYGSIVAGASVTNKDPRAKRVRLDAVVLNAEGFRVSFEEDELVVGPLGYAGTRMTILAPDRTPEVVDGMVEIVLIVTDLESGEVFAAGNPFWWTIYTPYEPDAEPLFWSSPLGIAAIVAGSVAGAGVTTGAGALLLRRESMQYRFLGAAALYSRIRRSEVFAHAARERIHALVGASPGLTLSEIRREMGLATGTTVHHLRTLERHGLVASRKDGSRRRFYPAGGVPRTAEPTPAQTRVLEALLEGPTTQADLARRLGLSRQAVHQHVKALADRGLVAADAEGRLATAAQVRRD